MSCLNLVPPILSGTVYFDGSFFIIMYLLIAFLGFSLPFLVESINKHLKKISTLLGSWFFSGFVVEILNLQLPEKVINNNYDKVMYLKVLVFFMVGLFVIIASDIWSKQKN